MARRKREDKHRGEEVIARTTRALLGCLSQAGGWRAKEDEQKTDDRIISTAPR